MDEVMIEVSIKLPGIDQPFVGKIISGKLLSDRLVAAHKEGKDPVKEFNEIMASGVFNDFIMETFAG